MRVRRIDKDGDWTFGQGRNNYADGSECVAQRVCTRLRSFSGDWFLDLEHGLPWLPRMERPADLAQIEVDIKRCILTTEGVSEILDFQISETPDDRRLGIAVTLRDSQGTRLSSSVQR